MGRSVTDGLLCVVWLACLVGVCLGHQEADVLEGMATRGSSRGQVKVENPLGGMMAAKNNLKTQVTQVEVENKKQVGALKRDLQKQLETQEARFDATRQNQRAGGGCWAGINAVDVSHSTISYTCCTLDYTTMHNCFTIGLWHLPIASYQRGHLTWTV